MPAVAFGLQGAQRVEPLGLGRRIALGLAEFDEGDGVVEIAVDLVDAAEPVFQHRALAHHLLRGFGIVPEIGVFGFGVQFGEAARRSLDVKDASSAIPRIA